MTRKVKDKQSNRNERQCKIIEQTDRKTLDAQSQKQKQRKTYQ